MLNKKILLITQFVCVLWTNSRKLIATLCIPKLNYFIILVAVVKVVVVVALDE